MHSVTYSRNFIFSRIINSSSFLLEALLFSSIIYLKLVVSMTGGRRFTFLPRGEPDFPRAFFEKAVFPFLVWPLCQIRRRRTHGLLAEPPPPPRRSPDHHCQGLRTSRGSPSALLLLRDARRPRHFAFHGNFRICLSTPKQHSNKRKQCWASDRDDTNLEIAWEETNAFTTPRVSELEGAHRHQNERASCPQKTRLTKQSRTNLPGGNSQV